ncbi:MAG TPA: dihydroorotate dehydrogenase-like protein [Xanthobacteraceae bacterium]|nr:dihydroorotate dehydrogenase-like protein [Xanthobacteraceae bacterium]
MNLATRYLGLALKNPIIASSSPLNFDIGNIRRLEDGGAAAVVLPSIFEEQVEREAADIERFTTAGIDSFAEALSYFPAAASEAAGPHRYLDLIRQAREAVDIPVIASLNGITDGGWTDYARLVEQAGAQAIELNVFFIPADPMLSGRQVEQRYIDILHAVKQVVHIPVAMKLNPYFSAIGHFVCELDRAGADAFVLFNRFYQPDIDVIALHLRRDLELSSPSEIRLPLLWIAVLAGQIRGSLAATTGVETAEQVIKYLLVGADAVMTTSALLRHGVSHIKVLLDGLTQWLDARDIAAIDSIRGSMSRRRIGDPTAFERANYIQILQGWKG